VYFLSGRRQQADAYDDAQRLDGMTKVLDSTFYKRCWLICWFFFCGLEVTLMIARLLSSPVFAVFMLIGIIVKTT
jgi:hypothetical protein